MPLITKDHMEVVSLSGLAKKLREEGYNGQLTMIIQDNKPIGMLLSYEIWFQVQHFISTVLESKQHE